MDRESLEGLAGAKVRSMGANSHVNMVQKEMPVLMLLGLYYLVFTHGVKDRPAQVIRVSYVLYTNSFQWNHDPIV